MRCLICNSLSLSHICKNCQKNSLKPDISKRKLYNDFYVYSFYKYKNIENLLKTKHTFIGSFIFEIMAKNSFYQFSQNYKNESKIFVIAVDDKIDSGYSHTSILAKSMKNSIFKPKFNSLKSRNSVSYSGKSYEFRIKNPRDFEYSGPRDVDVVLVDDIITTGLTLKEAYDEVSKYANVLYALTLADARD